VLTFWPYVWQLDPEHTYDEHLVLALKTGCDNILSNLNCVFLFYLLLFVKQTNKQTVWCHRAEPGAKFKQPLLWAWTPMCYRVAWAATHNVRHSAVRLHEAAVLLASVRPARLPSYPVAVESSSVDLIHRSGSFPRCTAGILSHLTAPLDLASLLPSSSIRLPRSRRRCRSLRNPNRRGAG
jgi:hypothetical protein